MIQTVVDQLGMAPDSQLDVAAKWQIAFWSDPPTALQILEVLDKCVHGGLASGFVIRLLQMLLDITIKSEGTTYEAVVSQAVWRNEA